MIRLLLLLYILLRKDTINCLKVIEVTPLMLQKICNRCCSFEEKKYAYEHYFNMHCSEPGWKENAI